MPNGEVSGEANMLPTAQLRVTHQCILHISIVGETFLWQQRRENEEARRPNAPLIHLLTDWPGQRS